MVCRRCFGEVYKCLRMFVNIWIGEIRQEYIESNHHFRIGRTRMWFINYSTEVRTRKDKGPDFRDLQQCLLVVQILGKTIFRQKLLSAQQRVNTLHFLHQCKKSFRSWTFCKKSQRYLVFHLLNLCSDVKSTKTMKVVSRFTKVPSLHHEQSLLLLGIIISGVV